MLGGVNNDLREVAMGAQVGPGSSFVWVPGHVSAKSWEIGRISEGQARERFFFRDHNDAFSCVAATVKIGLLRGRP